jgi:hypothetical protein
MDQLETLIIPTETVEFAGNSLKVTGLGLAQMTYIVREHRAAAADLYQRAITGKLDGSMEEIVLAMLHDFAPLASMVIACGLGSPKQADKAGSLPLGVQMQILEKIITLTLVDEGELEKLMEIVARAMAGTASLISRET